MPVLKFAKMASSFWLFCSEYIFHNIVKGYNARMWQTPMRWTYPAISGPINAIWHFLPINSSHVQWSIPPCQGLATTITSQRQIHRSVTLKIALAQIFWASCMSLLRVKQVISDHFSIFICSWYNLCCRLHRIEMSEAEGSNSSKQGGPGEGAIKSAKEGKSLYDVPDKCCVTM